MKTLDELTKETNGQTRFLYHLAYWDGPLTGIMLWEGERVYFAFDKEIVHEIPFNKEEKEEWRQVCEREGWEFEEGELFDYEYQWFYKVYRIPEKLLKQLDRQHEYFRKYVGTHTDYDENNKRPIDRHITEHKLRPYFLHGMFYRFYRKNIKIDKDKYEIIGEFER